MRTLSFMIILLLVSLFELCLSGGEGGSEDLVGGRGGGSQHIHRGNGCKTVFIQYTSSQLEKKWYQNVDKWQYNVCKHISNHEMNWWLGNISLSMRNPENHILNSIDIAIPKNEFDYTLSYFTYKRTCYSHVPDIVSNKVHRISTSQYFHIPIEPTAAIARDPRKCWSQMTETYTQSKEYLLPLSNISASYSAMKYFNPSKSFKLQNISIFLFDAGATFPSKRMKESHDWSGTSWIYDWYANLSLPFDHIYAWEPSKTFLNYSDVEPNIAQALHFFNRGINNLPGSEDNPLHLIKTLCKPQDIVIFKLDIDTVGVELNIVKEVLRRKDLQELIDDFYFEHHVRNDVMRMHGLGGNNPADRNLKSWYDMAIPARQKGFHMHFWP